MPAESSMRRSPTRRPRGCGRRAERRCPARSEPRSPGRGFWGQILIEEDLIDLPRDGQLGLELTDPALGRGKLHRLIGAQAIDLAAIDLLLLTPVVDRRLAH